MIAAIILAAGQSRRMGRLKQMLPWGEDVLLGRVIEICRDGGAFPILVVVGCDGNGIKKRLADRDVIWVDNLSHEEGMATSIQAGVKKLPSNIEAILLALGDLPLMEPDTIRGIIKAYYERKPAIIVPTFQGQSGHPVLFTRKFFPQLLALKGDIGARKVIQDNRAFVLEVSVNDSGICKDIDDPQAYARFQPTRED